MNKKNLLISKRWRLREEMKLRVLETLHNFKSIEEPRLKITNEDTVNVLSSIIAKRTS